MFHWKRVYKKYKDKDKELNGSSRRLLLAPLDYLDYSFRDRAVKPFLFLQNLSVGIKRNIHWYRAGAFKQCLDPE